MQLSIIISIRLLKSVIRTKTIVSTYKVRRRRNEILKLVLHHLEVARDQPNHIKQVIRKTEEEERKIRISKEIRLIRIFMLLNMTQQLSLLISYAEYKHLVVPFVQIKVRVHYTYILEIEKT